MIKKLTVLREGISHIEDLEVEEFIDAIRNIGTMQGSEKIDGATLYFGIDDQERLFAASEGDKVGAKKIYDPAEYPFYGANNVFRMALAAAIDVQDLFKRVLQPGQIVSASVVFDDDLGSKNYIGIVQGIQNISPEQVQELQKALLNKEATARSKIVQSSNGKDLEVKVASATFRFVKPKTIDSKLFAKADIEPKIKEFEAFLSQRAQSDTVKVSNLELLTMPLTSFDKDVRAEAKELRERVKSKVLLRFKLPIKKELLKNSISRIDTGLDGTTDDGKIQGAVLVDPSSGNSFKIVDREHHKTVADFQRSIRAKVNGVVKTTDPSAPLEARGGVLGNVKIRVSDLLGNRDLARTITAKAAISAIEAESVQDTIRELGRTLNGGRDPLGTIRKITAILTDASDQVKRMLDDFKAKQNEFRLKLASGKEIRLTPATIKRTMMVFAETQRDIDEKIRKMSSASTIENIIEIFYGHTIRAVRSGEADLKEATNSFGEVQDVLLEKRIDTDEKLFRVKDGWELLNIYLSTMFLTALIYKANDTIGIRLVRDQHHQRLQKFSDEMRPHNFWGYVVWRSNTPAVKKFIGDRTAQEVYRTVKQIPTNWWKLLHLDFSNGGNVVIDWEDHLNTLQKLIQLFPTMNTVRINELLSGSFTYDALSFDERVKLLPKMYYHAMQFIPSSPLIKRLRAIQHNLLLNPGDAVGTKNPIAEPILPQVIALAEEGEVGGEEAGAAQGLQSVNTTATTAATIANNQLRLSTSRGAKRGNTELRRRNIEKVKYLTMKFPRKGK